MFVITSHILRAPPSSVGFLVKDFFLLSRMKIGMKQWQQHRPENDSRNQMNTIRTMSNHMQEPGQANMMHTCKWKSRSRI